MNINFNFPGKWVDASILEEVLKVGGNPHDPLVFEIKFIFPVGCKLMIDASIRLLSLINQLDYATRRVSLDFREGSTGTMGYLNRVGFFDYISHNVTILPSRPLYSGANLYSGTNDNLVEIAGISLNHRDSGLPTRLSKALSRAYGNHPWAKELEGATWTIFAELIDNIFSHSSTVLDGYAALQLYTRGRTVKVIRVAVSDSGLGIMETLRPTLKGMLPNLDRLSDLDLLVEVFRQGISRHGADRGCGLKGSAAKAMKYNADLDVRLPNIRVLLSPGGGAYRPNKAFCYENLPQMWGTHISFTFHLDSGL